MKKNLKVDVAIIIGSKSDSDVIKDAIEILKKFSVSFEVKILSAHRSPNLIEEYIRTLSEKETKVIIAGAGKAAHLAGVLASKTLLPIIGIPIKTSDLGGLDSLLSTVQMPKGVPVATVAINGALNAALLAVQILALNDKALAKKLRSYKDSLEKEIGELNQ